MKASQFFISTLKEAPADAEVVSHKLMTRAGLIKKLGAGIYNYMPMGLRVIRKVEAIVREEIDRKSTRLNSSHSQISYAVFCLKKKKKNTKQSDTLATE